MGNSDDGDGNGDGDFMQMAPSCFSWGWDFVLSRRFDKASSARIAPTNRGRSQLCANVIFPRCC